MACSGPGAINFLLDAGSAAMPPKHQHPGDVTEIAEALAGEPSADQHEADAEIDAQRLRMAVRALPPEQRAAVALFHFEEMSVAEVAVALDVPMGTVKTRLMHARRKLRAAMEGDI